jgi:Prokaryotic metallothionein
MPQATCAHCGTAITHHETMQESGGKTYCCRNCLAMAAGAIGLGGGPRCAHCESAIVDQSTKVDRGGQTFCCENCADAVSAGAPHRSP